MAEEVKETETQTPLLAAFMKAGKISVFESGLDRPDHLQDRPFFNLLPKGKTSFINMSETADKLYVKSAEEQVDSPALDTEAHKFFENMEKRFRTVMPGVTLFIIDPDAVQGRYLMDQSADRSLGKSLYMHVEEKLQKAAAGNNQTFLTQKEILQSVSEAGITDRNPFSMRAAVAPTLENLAGLGNVNLVVGDNPDAMSANVLDMVAGAEERRLKEGISRDEFRRLVLYHELGHATDHNYASAYNSIEKIAETELDNVMCRHRTECIADAHAVLQLARDFGTTKCAELWSDCRIEYLRMSVDRRLEDTKYDTEFVSKLRAAEEKSHAQNPNDPDYENNFKQLMADKQVADTIKKLGSPLAYHTTDVIDATVKWAQEHLADGSLQKMSDLEVIKQAQVMSETYGLTRQQMAEMSIALAKGEKHPKYEQMMERVQESRDHMPISNKKLEEEYETQRELNAYMEAAQLSAGLGLPMPEQNFSRALKKKLIQQQIDSQKMEMMGRLSVAQYQQDLLDKLENTSSREEMHTVLGQEKEALRTAGKNDKGEKDLFAASKLKVVDAVIDQAPNVEAILAANKSIKKQLDGIKSSTEVSGDEAIVHFIKNELRVATSMSQAFYKAYSREPEKMTAEDQMEAMRSEFKDFKKAMLAEKETQIAAFAIRSDKKAWAKVSQDPVLAQLIDQKAKQKPTAALGQYQMNMGNMDKNTAAALFQDVAETHKYLVETFTGNSVTASALKTKDMRTFETMKKYSDALKKTERTSPLNLKNFKIEPKKTALDVVLKAQNQRG
ncbi:MAG: hypothetical protein IJ752_09020 [Alphaproteobacteria bacterium]|nr:hypothetical protein [Alphaproteobacteria bacterium]